MCERFGHCRVCQSLLAESQRGHGVQSGLGAIICWERVKEPRDMHYGQVVSVYTEEMSGCRDSGNLLACSKINGELICIFEYIMLLARRKGYAIQTKH